MVTGLLRKYLEIEVLLRQIVGVVSTRRCFWKISIGLKCMKKQSQQLSRFGRGAVRIARGRISKPKVSIAPHKLTLLSPITDEEKK